MASITGFGTFARRAPRFGTGSIACRTITAVAVGPVKGGLPASISYTMHPRA